MSTPRRWLALPALAALSLAIPQGAAKAPEYRRTALVGLSAGIELRSPPAKVWEALVEAGGFAALTGFRVQDAAERLAEVGDHAAASIWDDQGTLVCTWVDPGKELRVSFEPAKGHYVCHKTVKLEPSGSGTRLSVLDRYSDDRKEGVDETAKEVAAEMTKALAAFAARVDH